MLSEIECRRPLQSSHRIPFMGRSNFSIQLFRMGGNAQRCEGMRIQNAHPDLVASWNVQSVEEFPTVSCSPPFWLNAGKRLREILVIKMVVTRVQKVWIIHPAAVTSALAPIEDLSGPQSQTRTLTASSIELNSIEPMSEAKPNRV